jgi:hypothetical protein
MKPQPFFLVWNPTRGAPTVKQATYGIAENEAKRLARQAPGEEFFVLACVARVQKIDVGVTRFTIDPDKHARECMCEECLPF